jgi:PKD repeat protein
METETTTQKLKMSKQSFGKQLILKKAYIIMILSLLGVTANAQCIAPVAHFSGDSVCYGNATSFFDLSTISSGSIVSWAWYFNDGSPTNTTQNPSHLYAAPGNYNVTLVVVSNLGCADSITKSIQVSGIPVANFTTNSACLGNVTQFVNLSTISFGNIVSWSWNFGDNAPNSTVFNPSHLYANAGTYIATLIATSDLGCSNAFYDTILVNNCSSGPHGFNITGPTAGATINNRCDIHFCVHDSIGWNINSYDQIWVSISPSANGNPRFTGIYPVGADIHNFCLDNDTGFDSLSGGTHTFYLWYKDGSTNLNYIVDSVNVTVANLMSGLTFGNQTFGSIPGTNGDYTFWVAGLDSTATYTVSLIDQNNNTLESSNISNVSSDSLTHHYLHNGIYYPRIDVQACDGEHIVDLTEVATITNSSCLAYTSISGFYTYNQHDCNGNGSDSTVFYATVCYSNLPANGTSLAVMTWGDGTSDTILVPHNGITDSCVSIVGAHYTWSAPGSYTSMLKFYDQAACYNDSAITTTTIGNITCNLSGTVYDDANNNCTQDIGEPGVANILVTVTENGTTYPTWTDANGNYLFNYLPAGSYTIQVNNINVGYSVVCSNSLPHTTNVTTTPTIENFALSCSGSFDVAVTGISLFVGFYPGTYDAILPHVGILNGACNLNIPGQVKMILTSCIQYTTGGNYPWFNNPPTAIIHASTGDTLVWNVSDINNMGTFSYWDYAVNISTCTNAQVGDTACITMMVLPTNGDADLSNNTFTRCFAIGVAYDPNSKEVEPKGLGSQGAIPANTPNLTYTINFQNTGTAVARNIYVLDSVDTDLNINSIEILSASHGMQVYQLANRTIKFMFANIMLPDSTHDLAHSHGYITFRIKPNAGLAMGTKIKNTGYIYFDYNAPVVTNTTLNTIAAPTGINEISKSGLLKVYPNPAKDKLIVSVSNNGTSIITISDVLGKAVKQIKTSELQTEINVSDLQDGIYFIQLTQDNENYVEKVIINK